MKKLLFFLASSLLVVLVMSCGQEQDSTMEYTIEQTHSSDLVNEYKTNLGHTIKITTGTAPMNERVDITDDKGRPMVVAGRASECDVYTLVKYLYDDKGNVYGFLTFPFSDAEQSNYDASHGEEIFEKQFDEDSYVEEPFYYDKNFFDLVFTKGNDEPYFVRYYFQRDKERRIIKVYDPILHKSITADKMWHIEYKIEEDYEFWTSDIRGGKVWPTFTFKPNPGKERDDNDKRIMKKKYYGYVEFRDMKEAMDRDFDD